MEPQRLAHCRNTVGDAVDRQRGGGDQPADEAAARLVMAAQQHEDRKQQHQRREEGSDRAQDQRVHGSASLSAPAAARPLRMRMSDRIARPVIITTAISPSVSVPRKSTMMTFTTLDPWAMVLA